MATTLPAITTTFPVQGKKWSPSDWNGWSPSNGITGRLRRGMGGRLGPEYADLGCQMEAAAVAHSDLDNGSPNPEARAIDLLQDVEVALPRSRQRAVRSADYVKIDTRNTGTGGSARHGLHPPPVELPGRHSHSCSSNTPRPFSGHSHKVQPDLGPGTYLGLSGCPFRAN
jgi:hypothetical protein